MMLNTSHRFAPGLDPPPSLTCDRTLLSAAMTVGMPSFVEQPAAGQGITWRDLGHLTGVFPFKHLTASEDQQRPSWLLTQLQCFIAALQEQVSASSLASSLKNVADTLESHPIPTAIQALRSMPHTVLQSDIGRLRMPFISHNMPSKS